MASTTWGSPPNSPIRGTTRMNCLHSSSLARLPRWSMKPLVSGTRKTGRISSSICLTWAWSFSTACKSPGFWGGGGREVR